MTHQPRRQRTVFAGIVLSAAMVVAACGGDDSGGVDVSGAWARTSPMMTDAGAAYMTIESDEAISIVSASAPDVAETVELHETVPVDGGHMEDGEMEDGEMDDGEMEMETAMTMQQVASIDIEAGGSVSLAPGGLHVMLLDLVDPLELGDEFDLVFTTADGEEITVPIEVRDEAP